MSASAEKAMVSLFGLELLAAISGNIFLVVLLYKSKSISHSASQNFILNCSVADLISCLINLPFAMDYLLLKTGNLNGTVAPAVINFMTTFLMLLTLHSTLIMMADRLLIIKFPVTYKNMVTVKRGRLAIVNIWCSTFLITLILTLFRVLRSSSSSPNQTPMEYMEHQFKTNGGKFFVFFMIALMYAALAILTGMLYKALRKLIRSNRVEDADSNPNGSLSCEQKRINKSSRTVLLVMMIYMICYSPTMINAFLRILDSPLMGRLSATTRAFVVLFCAHFTSVFNPIVFIVRSSVLMKAAKKLFKIRTLPLNDDIELFSRSHSQRQTSQIRRNRIEDIYDKIT